MASDQQRLACWDPEIGTVSLFLAAVQNRSGLLASNAPSKLILEDLTPFIRSKKEKIEENYIHSFFFYAYGRNYR